MRHQAAILSGLLLTTPAFAGHSGSGDLSPRQVTPGVQLELQEFASGRNITPKRYKLLATGYPRDVTFGVYTKAFSDSFVEVVSGFRVDSSGNLVVNSAARPQRLQDLEFGPGPYPRGAAWEVAVAALDRSIAAFARVIPNPIMARDGECIISLELLSQRADRFLVTGNGFVPGDDVIAEFKHDGRVEKKRKRISSDGILPRHVVAHAATGIGRSARYTVKGHSCEVAIDYEWGEPALGRR